MRVTEFCKEFERPDPTANENYAKLHDVLREDLRGRRRGAGAGPWCTTSRSAMFVFLPLLALAMKLLYWRPKRYYVEHLLFLIHNHAFVFLALSAADPARADPRRGRSPGPARVRRVAVHGLVPVPRACACTTARAAGSPSPSFSCVGFAYFVAAVVVLVLTDAVYSAMIPARRLTELARRSIAVSATHHEQGDCP